MKHSTYCLSKAHQLSDFAQTLSSWTSRGYPLRLNTKTLRQDQGSTKSPERSRGIFQRKRMSAGFTLVEVMFAVVIGLIIMGTIMVLYVKVNHSMIMGVTLAEINSDARLTMDHIVRDVRWATQLEANRSIDGVNYTTGDDELIIEIPSIDVNGKFILNTYDYVVYALDPSDSTKLRKIVDPDIASSRSSLNQIIANNLNSFSLSSEGTALSIANLGSVTSVKVFVNVNKTPLLNKTVSETIASNVEFRNN